ncbi:MAG: PGF-pre-PGF domain-containing protein, partial [Nanoarchaeota archaeon]
GLKYLVIDTNGNQPTSGAAQISFSINKEGVNKDRINLYVWEGTSWTKLTTHYDGETATEYTYTATTPHFSIFMIGESTAFSRSSGGDGIVQNNSLQSVNNVKINNEVTPLSSETPTTTETPNNKGFFSFLTGAVTGLINSGAGVPAILFLMIVIAGTIVLVVVRRRGK